MKPYYEHAGITIYHGDSAHITPMLDNREANAARGFQLRQCTINKFIAQIL